MVESFLSVLRLEKLLIYGYEKVLAAFFFKPELHTFCF